MPDNFIKRILIINLGGIGDFLLSTPALRALDSLYPHAEISLLATERINTLVKNLSYIDILFNFNLKCGGIIPLGKKVQNLKTLFSLRKKHFDLSINMRTLGSQKSARKIKSLVAFIKPKKSAGRNTEGRGAFFDIKIHETDVGQKFEMEYDIETVKALGATVTDKTIDFDIDDESIHSVNKILEGEGILKETVLIGIHPGGMPSRRWPLENFVQSINGLAEKIPCHFVITGGKDERELGKRLEKEAKAKLLNLIGISNIKELGAIIKRCNLFMTNDTGPMHMAAILRIPMIALFGPGDIKRYDPRYLSDKAIVLHDPVECASPCNQIKCDTMICFDTILPDQVVTTAMILLGENVSHQ